MGADFGFSTASYTQAYRAFPVEQGNDTNQAQIQTTERALQTEGVSAQAQAEVMDVVTISPAAAQLLAEQTLLRRRVRAKAETGKPARHESVTASLLFGSALDERPGESLESEDENVKDKRGQTR